MIKLATANPAALLALQKIPLLRHFFVFYLPALDKVRDEELRDSLFSYLRYGDATGKCTVRGRFKDLDEKACNYIENGALILDVGVSSGVTSVDLLHALHDAGKSVRFTISDKFGEVAVSGKNIVRVFDSERRLRSIYLWRILCDPGLGPVFFVSRWLYHLLSHCRPNFPARRLLLLSRTAMRAIEDRRITFRHFDVFGGGEPDYDFVRCMNVLNRSYFTDQTIRRGLETLSESLREGAILLVGRTVAPGTNRATFYKKSGLILQPVLHVNGGAEIDDIVESLNQDHLS